MFASSDDLPPVDDDVFGERRRFPECRCVRLRGRLRRLVGCRLSGIRPEPVRRSSVLRRHVRHSKRSTKVSSPTKTPASIGTSIRLRPGTSDTVQLFEREGQLFAFGLVSQAVLEMLMARYTGIDWDNMDVAVATRRRPRSAAAAAARLCEHRREGRRGSAQILRRPSAIRAKPAAAPPLRGRTPRRCRAIF